MLNSEKPIQKNDLLKFYQNFPVNYIQEGLDAESIEDYQERAIEMVYFYDKIAIRACHSVGKTWLMARVVLWFLNNHKDSIVITTAPTHRQVKALLWGELRAAHKSAKRPIGGKLLDMELKFDEKHYAMGFSPKKEAKQSTAEQIGSSFQGFHSKYVMVVFDEATGITPDVWTMADGLLTSGIKVKFVAIANPTTKNCDFYKCFSSPEWMKMRISCFDSPNLIANGLTSEYKLQEEIDRLKELSDAERISVIQAYKKPVPHLLTAQWVVPYVYARGMTHPLVRSKALGKFPINEDNVFIQYEDVEKAIKRTVEPQPEEKLLIGIDVARYGEDSTVITGLKGYKQVYLKALNKRDLVHVTGESVRVINDLYDGSDMVVCVDATGLGAGVFDMLKEKQREGIIPKNVRLMEIHNGARPLLEGEDKDKSTAGLKAKEEHLSRYANLKARQWDLLAEDIGQMDLYDESIYYDEVPSIKYSFDSKGKYVVESKKDFKARTSRPSPDHSDSLALANLGRHVSIKHGSFLGREKTEPRVKQERAEERSSRIKVTEY